MLYKLRCKFVKIVKKQLYLRPLESLFSFLNNIKKNLSVTKKINLLDDHIYHNDYCTFGSIFTMISYFSIKKLKYFSIVSGKNRSILINMLRMGMSFENRKNWKSETDLLIGVASCFSEELNDSYITFAANCELHNSNCAIVSSSFRKRI